MNHVDLLLWDWLLGALSESESLAIEEHLDQCDVCRALLDEQVALLAAASAEEPASRDRLLTGATSLARFEHWTDDIAALADVTAAQARDWLAHIDTPDVWTPTALGEIELFHIEGGPAVERAVIGFVRIAPGTGFPEHTHLGNELIFVLQGALRDENGVVHRPGSLVRGAVAHTHEIFAEPGVPLVYLSIVQEGLEIFGMRFGPDSPDL